MGARKANPTPRKVRAEVFTVELVESLLHQARAPEPWARPEKLADAASMLASCAELSAGLPGPIFEHVKQMRRAQKAVDELRRVLPNLIGFHMAGVKQPGLLAGPDTASDHATRAIALHNMQAALTDVEGSLSSTQVEKLLTGWHIAAATAHLAYLSVVGQGSGSKGGPGARFVQLALEASGHVKYGLSAIESALTAHPLTQKR